jgi:hypothetical protein
MTQAQIDEAVDGFLKIGAFIDDGLKQQTTFDLEALESACGRTLSSHDRETFMSAQHQANRWTYLGTGLTHKNFLETLGKLSPAKRAMIEGVSSTFC